MNVGFIGLGRMGSGMASRILSGGHDLTVFDAVASQVSRLAAAGARGASSVADVCAGRDVVVTMLVEDAAVIEVALGTGGLCDSLSSGAVHLIMGTHGVATVRALEARHAASGQHLVAAPVLGRPDLAAAPRHWRDTQPLHDAGGYVIRDESGVTTDLLRRYGRSPRGTRLRDHTPCGHWQTQTVIAALRVDGCRPGRV